MLLLLVYTTTAFGVAINFHYCDNQLTKISVLNFGGHGGCDCGSGGMPMNCCKDKLCYHIGDNHNSTRPVVLTNAESFSIDIPRPADNLFTYALAKGSNHIIQHYDALRSYTQHLFLLNSVFRI